MIPKARSQGMARPEHHPPILPPRSKNLVFPAIDFVDVAQRAGLAFRHVSGDRLHKSFLLESTGAGVAVIDYDNDGLPDLFFVNGTKWTFSAAEPRPTSHLYHNLGHLRFEDVTAQSGLSAVGWGQGVCVGDYDNDGYDDLFVTYYGHNMLYHNDGNGRFRDVTEEAGLPVTGTRWGTGCSFVDYDRDGHLDIAVANYLDFDPLRSPRPGDNLFCQFKGLPVACGPRGMKGGVNVLYHNEGNGKFRDVSKPSGFETSAGYTCFSTVSGDFDGDGWPDIFVACDSTPSILFHNNHDGTFTDIGTQSGTAFNANGEEQGSMGADAGDVYHNGREDLVKTNFDDDVPTFYRNDGGGFFTDVTYQARLGALTHYVGWGTGFIDFDNDGWLDLVMANGHVYPTVDRLRRESKFKEPKHLYWNLHDGTFADVSNKAGLGITTPASGRGLAYGDLDNGGSVDIVINNLDASPSLLVNKARTAGNWILIKTVGSKSNSDAIGAMVTVKAGGTIQTAEVRSGCCYMSQSDLRLHFGLGVASRVDLLEVRWPSGAVERFPPPSVNGAVVVLVEGTGLQN
jgi:hypothetical protein